MPEGMSMTLYHAGRSINSARALDQLKRLVGEFGIDPAAIEYVDVFVERRRALEDRVMMTPALKVAFDGQVSWFFGDLTDDQQLVDMLKQADEVRS